MRIAALVSAVLLGASSVTANGLGVDKVRKRYEERSAKKQWGLKEPVIGKVAARDSFLFLNANTTKFAVNGTGIPEVDFDVGESYAGSLPISNRADEDSNLFFWFFPSTSPASKKEIVIWLNGGPGCSSLEGLLQENGPFLWQYGTYKPVKNPWSWHTLTNMIWVEQPVGTGFSTGSTRVTSQDDVARHFMGFWKNFVDTFGLQGYKIYIAGESYAGLYCPYIASAMLDANDTTYFDMSGLMIYDPSLTSDTIQQSIPVVPFVDYWSGLFPFNDTFRAYIHDTDKKCNFSSYTSEYLVFPPKGPQPQASKLPGYHINECEWLFYDVLDAAMTLNPCFDIYQIATTCPLLWDVSGFPGSGPYLPAGASIYFNRSDVKAAINAPQDVNWHLCAEDPVFVNGYDSSPPSIFSALPHVVDSTKNVIVAHGVLDFILIANGTLLALQNMTWGGQLGFQNQPTHAFYVPQSNLSAGSLGTLASEGVFGTTISERGLTYVGVALAGHMIPQYAPSAAYRQLEFLLGRVDCLNCTKPFTTDPEHSQSDQALRTGTVP